jgi:hypothetical protein
MNFDNMMQSELSIDFLMSYYDNYDIFYRFYDTFYDCNYMNERFTNSNGSLNVYFKCPKYLEKNIWDVSMCQVVLRRIFDENQCKWLFSGLYLIFKTNFMIFFNEFELIL